MWYKRQVNLRRWTGLQERFEGSDLGRAVISGLVIVTLLVIVVANLPPSAIKRELTRVADPYIGAVGIYQVWGVFAPDPLRTSFDVEARVRYEDGTEGTWRPPHGWPFPDSYRDVHWIRWLEIPGRPSFDEPAARWLARELATDGKQPAQITLIQRSQGLLPPGRTPDRTPVKEKVLFTYDVAEEKLTRGNS